MMNRLHMQVWPQGVPETVTWPDGTLYDNLAKTARAHGDRPALIYHGATTTYAQLNAEVEKLAGFLQNTLGVSKGDRVLLYMQNSPQFVVGYYAILRADAVVVPVNPMSRHAELEHFARDTGANVALAGQELLPYITPIVQEGLLSHVVAATYAEAASPDRDIPLPGELDSLRSADATGPGVIRWADALERATPPAPHSATRDDLAVIPYSSGTTGQPKGVVRHTGGHLVALNWSMKNIYNVDPGDTFWAASDVGWVVGHSYICYAPLIHGNTTIVFEGKPVGTPDAGTFWRVISEHNVRSFFTAPTAFRAVKRDDPKGEFVGKYDLGGLRAVYLAGERADPDTINWAANVLGKPIYDHWWQTETGWTIAGMPAGIEALPVKVGSPTVPMPGYDVQILDEAGHPMKPGELGAIAVKLPLPPGTLPTLWNAEARFRKSYLEHFPGYYETGDAGMIDEDGYLYIMARTDDVINVAGHRLSTGAMEEVLANHPDVAECAVIGVSDELKGQLPVGFVCLTTGVNRPHDEIARECVAMVRDQIGPVAAFKLACVVDRLPKTRSGKILRATMVKIADGEAFKMPATIDDPAILDEIAEALKSIGYPKG